MDGLTALELATANKHLGVVASLTAEAATRHADIAASGARKLDDMRQRHADDEIRLGEETRAAVAAHCVAMAEHVGTQQLSEGSRKKAEMVVRATAAARVEHERELGELRMTHNKRIKDCNKNATRRDRAWDKHMLMAKVVNAEFGAQPPPPALPDPLGGAGGSEDGADPAGSGKTTKPKKTKKNKKKGKQPPVVSPSPATSAEYEAAVLALNAWRSQRAHTRQKMFSLARKADIQLSSLPHAWPSPQSVLKGGEREENGEAGEDGEAGEAGEKTPDDAGEKGGGSGEKGGGGTSGGTGGGTGGGNAGDDGGDGLPSSNVAPPEESAPGEDGAEELAKELSKKVKEGALQAKKTTITELEQLETRYAAERGRLERPFNKRVATCTEAEATLKVMDDAEEMSRTAESDTRLAAEDLAQRLLEHTTSVAVELESMVEQLHEDQKEEADNI